MKAYTFQPTSSIYANYKNSDKPQTYTTAMLFIYISTMNIFFFIFSQNIQVVNSNKLDKTKFDENLIQLNLLLFLCLL